MSSLLESFALEDDFKVLHVLRASPCSNCFRFLRTARAVQQEPWNLHHAANYLQQFVDTQQQADLQHFAFHERVALDWAPPKANNCDQTFPAPILPTWIFSYVRDSSQPCDAGCKPELIAVVYIHFMRDGFCCPSSCL